MGKFQASVPSAKFDQIGTTYAGVVVDIEEVEVPHFNDKGRIQGIETDDEGNPVTQLDVTIQPTEGGKVAIHCKPAIYYAIGRALGEIGAEDLELGDTLEIAYVGDGEPTAKGRNAPKQYAAVITKA